MFLFLGGVGEGLAEWHNNSADVFFDNQDSFFNLIQVATFSGSKCLYALDTRP